MLQYNKIRVHNVFFMVPDGQIKSILYYGIAETIIYQNQRVIFFHIYNLKSEYTIVSKLIGNTG